MALAVRKCGNPSKRIKFQLDSGVTVNVVSADLSPRMFRDIDMALVDKAGNTTLRMYNITEITPVGSRAVRVTYPKIHTQYNVRF